MFFPSKLKNNYGFIELFIGMIEFITKKKLKFENKSNYHQVWFLVNQFWKIIAKQFAKYISYFYTLVVKVKRWFDKANKKTTYAIYQVFKKYLVSITISNINPNLKYYKLYA